MHKGTPNGGSHHRSVFRLHVGGALLARGGFPGGIADTWGRGSSSGSDAVYATTELYGAETVPAPDATPALVEVRATEQQRLPV